MLLKKAKNRLLTRAARNRRPASSNANRAATARERSGRIPLPQLVRPLIAAAGCLTLAFIAVSLLYPQETPQQSPPAANVATPRAVIDRYCIGCHNATLKTAGLMLDRLDPSHLPDHPEAWEKVTRKFRTGEMPPPGLPRPDAATYARTAAQLEAGLDAAAAVQTHPGRVPVHRLNRNEYAAAIRDLFGLDVDPKALLPGDDADQEGFDNVASVLSISPLLLENYMSAARRISRLAVNDLTLNPVIDTFKISKAMVQEDQMSDDLPFGSQGGALIPYYFPLDGEYTIKVSLRREEYDYLVGMGEPHQIDFRLDGALLKRFTIGGAAKGKMMPETYAGNTQGDPEFEAYMQTADSGLEARFAAKAGEHKVGISFVRRYWEPEGVLQPPQTGFARSTNEYYHGEPAVEIVMIGGPYSASASLDSATRRKLFVCNPGRSAEEESCAKKVLSTLATRAYRRPLTDQDVQSLMSFYRAGREGQTFSAGVQQGVERILASPSFLFRVEREPLNLTAGEAYPLSELDLASRLSFFLWSSVPDGELLDAAIHRNLKDQPVWEQQARRMLRDPRSKALVNNFATRWLELNKLAGVVPDTKLYPEFDENLRDAMMQETLLFVESQMREDRPVSELVNANYTFLNERLAKHYGIPNIYGSNFRRVASSDGMRSGLLSQASILTVTAYPNRTSVTMRGRWLLANLLGAPPPPPPPNIPLLKEAGANGQPRALRERMEIHRQNPACASCHQRMDPLGFSLENFDADGKWRSEADGAPVDATATLPDGSRFDGLNGLRALLASHKEDFVRTFTGKLLAYAIGRGIEYSDQPAIRKIVRDAAASDYRWSSIILGITESVPFRMGVAVGSDQEGRR
jgi:mono/diheme cytochrome c family protein